MLLDVRFIYKKVDDFHYFHGFLVILGRLLRRTMNIDVPKSFRFIKICNLLEISRKMICNMTMFDENIIWRQFGDSSVTCRIRASKKGKNLLGKNASNFLKLSPVVVLVPRNNP